MTSDASWAFQPVLSWVFQHVKYKFVYWVDPALMDVNGIKNGGIGVDVMNEEGSTDFGFFVWQ